MQIPRRDGVSQCNKRVPMWVAGLALLMQLSSTASVRADERIVLRPEMVLNETAIGDATKLVDEQNAVGDPGAGKGVRPERPFFPGWTSWQYPINVLIDLGAFYNVTRLYLYNETGESPLILSTGKPFAWKGQNVTLGGYREWKEFPLSTTTRYLRITLTRPSSLPELVLYGEKRGQPAPAPPLPKRVKTTPTMDQFVGTNAFIDDPLDKLGAAVGFVREYHNWLWDNEAPDKKTRFQPSGAAGGNLWFFDDFYGRLKTLGVTVCPAIQNSSPAYFPGLELDFKPVVKGADAEAPASYAIHAAHLFQYAARYGSAHVPDDQLQLGPGQPRSTGLGSLRYIENWNEPDKTWRGREGRFSPYELAAMCSADYDGDQGRMGKTFGVRSADPKMKLVLGGLAGLSLEYLRGMKLWADAHRGGDFPADVINLHHYSSDGDEQQAFKTTGISPEADHLREKLSAIAAWRDANVPKCELWLTEFGYDTNPKSPFHAPAIGSYSAEEVQGMWLIRSYMALAAAGVDRAAMFMFRDVKSDGGGVFETSGMVTEKGQWKPKPSYYYIGTLKQRLAGMRFAGEISSGKKDVLIYRFTGEGGKTAYMVWCTAGEDRKVPNVSFSVNGKTAEQVEFADNSLEGKVSPVTIKQGQITIEAREKPVIVLVH
jgi:hypothetical protein